MVAKQRTNTAFGFVLLHCSKALPSKDTQYLLLIAFFFLQKRRQQHERIPNICPPPMEGTIFSQRNLKKIG
jgi:hypothetical protein